MNSMNFKSAWLLFGLLVASLSLATPQFSSFRDIVKGDIECAPPLMAGDEKICIPGAEYDSHRGLCCLPKGELDLDPGGEWEGEDFDYEEYDYNDGGEWDEDADYEGEL